MVPPCPIFVLYLLEFHTFYAILFGIPGKQLNNVFIPLCGGICIMYIFFSTRIDKQNFHRLIHNPKVTAA